MSGFLYFCFVVSHRGAEEQAKHRWKCNSWIAEPQFLSRVHFLQIVFGKPHVCTTNMQSHVEVGLAHPFAVRLILHTSEMQIRFMGCVNSVAASFLTVIRCLFAPCGYLQASFVQGYGLGLPEQYLKPRRPMLSSPT